MIAEGDLLTLGLGTTTIIHTLVHICMLNTELPLDCDFLTSRILISLARLIEGTEDICLLPLVGTYVIPKRSGFNEFCTHFSFTMLSGRLDAFETLLIYGQTEAKGYSFELKKDNSFRNAMQHIAQSFLPPTSTVVKFEVNVEIGVNVDVWLRWRAQTFKHEQIEPVHNQISDPSKVKTTWNNLRFRSHSEMRVAAALDEAGLLFLPNCLGRLSSPAGRKNLECDFLVCSEGKWGILEVDGEPFHPPSRTVQDHERDRLFKTHGILVVEHFDARECFENAKGVVKKFIGILKML